MSTTLSLDLVVDRIEILCQKAGITKSRMLEEVSKINGCDSKKYKSIVDNLKKGSAPTVDKLFMIANYFDCSVDYLLGRTDEPQQKTEVVKDSNNTGGVHVFDFTVPVTTYPASSEQQQEIDRMMSDLSPRERNKLMGMIYDYYDECKKESE